MLLYSRHSPVLLVSFLVSTIVIATNAANYRMTGFCSNKKDGSHRNPYNCNSYYECLKGGSKETQCPEGLTFNNNTSKCDKTECTEDPGFLDRAITVDDPNFCVGKNKDYYRNPSDCGRFYRCANGFTYAFACPTALYYNPKIMACDWPKNVQCSLTPTLTTRRPWVTTRRPWVTTRRPWVTTRRPWVTTRRPWVTRTTRFNPWRTTRFNPWRTTPPTFIPWTVRTTPYRPITRGPTFIPWTTRRVFTTGRPYVPPTRGPVTNNAFGGCNKVVCYFVNWAQYRSGNARQFPRDVNPSLCSHIMFAFSKLQGNTIVPFEFNDLNVNFPQVIALKQINRNLKVSLALGGWNMGSDTFSRMVSTPMNRQEFITTTIAFLRRWGFDGIDIDWEYPANRGSPASDRQRHAQLLTELRSAIDQEAVRTGNQRLLLTAAVSAGKATIDSAYNIPVMNSMLDFVNLMAYDLHGSWETKTGHNSALFGAATDTGAERYLNVDWATRYWIQNGASPHKIVLGLPLYGRTFRLAGFGGYTGIGAAAAGNGTAGMYTGTAGFLSYYEICQKIRNGGQVHRLNDQRVPYMVSGSDWIGYDDAESLRGKVTYAKRMNLGGVMIWDLSMDDFRGTFCNEGQWPLLNAVVNQCRAP